jgi:hypothetical protein
MLHAEMDYVVAAAYCWANLDLSHGFHDTNQGIRYSICETARREVLGRLLALNHQRHAEEEDERLSRSTPVRTARGRDQRDEKRDISGQPEMGLL